MPQATEPILEELLRPAFGPVIVRRDSDAGAENSFDVFCIPDERLGVFVEFCMDSLTQLLSDRNLEPVSLIPHGLSATGTYYPGIGTESARQIASAVHRQATTGGTIPARATAPRLE